MTDFSELIPVGKKFVSPGRTIGEGEFSLLTDLTWVTSEPHTNREFMKRTPFGERILVGPCVLACATGLAMAGELPWFLKQVGLRPVALLGYEDVRFTTPVKPGDTLTVQSEFAAIRRTSKNPKQGILKIKEVVFNQDEKEVMSSTRLIMVEVTTWCGASNASLVCLTLGVTD